MSFGATGFGFGAFNPFINLTGLTPPLTVSGDGTLSLGNAWTATLTNNTPTTVLTVATTNNSTVIITSQCSFFDSAGTDMNKGATRTITSRVTNNAGTLSISSIEYTTNEDTGLTGVSLTHTASGSSLLVQVAGLTGDTFLVHGSTITST